MYGLFFLGKIGGNLNKHMKIKYRKPTLIEQMTEAIETAKQPIDYFELSQTEFQSIFNSLDKSKSGDTITYSYKGISIKVLDE